MCNRWGVYGVAALPESLWDLVLKIVLSVLRVCEFVYD